VLLAVVSVLIWRCQADDPYVASPPAPVARTADPVAASATLSSLQEALRAGDGAAAAELGADAAAADLLGAAADNAASLRLDDLTLRYLSESGAVTGGSWSAAVELTWRFRGYDATASHAEVEITFADAGATIAAVGGEAAAVGTTGPVGDAAGGLTPLWLQGPVSSRRAPGALVLTTGPASSLDGRLAQVRQASAEVRRVLGGRPSVVVEIPESPAALDRALGTDPGRYAAVAAVTTSADASLAPGSPLHVFVNPEVFGRLERLAAQVVMTHEAVHVVTEAPLAQQAPLWLLEGFADYVALRDVDLPVTRSAGQVIAQVQDAGVPDALPSRVEFDTAGTHLGATYEAAWLACVVLAEQGGERALVDLYRDVLGGADIDAALERRVGWTTDELTTAWQQRLRALAG
jgi:hypothetical protein